MYWVQFVYLQEKTEALNEEEHMFLGLHLCKKYRAPEVVRGGGGTFKKKSFISHTSSSWHLSLLLPFLPDLSHPQVQENHEMLEQSGRGCLTR